MGRHRFTRQRRSGIGRCLQPSC